LIEEDSGREARIFFPSKTLNFRVEVEKVRCEPLSLFLVVGFRRDHFWSCPLGVLVPSILIEEDSGREARGIFLV
jgi:hypothetical protein